MINELALFAGGGGGLLATEWLLGWQTVCYIEKEPYAVEIIKARIKDGFLHDAPIWDDANTFDGHPWAGLVDVVSAGFPCQPFSNAGKRLADKDDRNGWPATIRIIREVRPTIAWLENVASLTSYKYFGTILGDLAEAGYGVIWNCLSAKAIGANHERNRLWLLAYSESELGKLRQFTREAKLLAQGHGVAWHVAHANGREKGCQPENKNGREAKFGNVGSNISDPNSERREKLSDERVAGDALIAGRSNNAKFAHTDNPTSTRQRKHSGQIYEESKSKRFELGGSAGWWAIEPKLGRVAHGVARRLDRHKAIGNGQVPEVARSAFIMLLERVIERIDK